MQINIVELVKKKKEHMPTLLSNIYVTKQLECSTIYALKFSKLNNCNLKKFNLKLHEKNFKRSNK